MTAIEPSFRHRVAASFALASALVERDPDLVVVETHPGGGQYDVLTLRRPGVGSVVGLNRVGAISVPGSARRWSWSEVVAADTPADLASAIAREAGIPTDAGSASTEAMALGVLVRVAAAHLLEGATWDIRSEVDDTAGWESRRRGFVDRFPDAAQRLAVATPDDLLGEPGYRFWAVLRDGDPVAVVETTGLAWTATGEVDLAMIADDRGVAAAAGVLLAGL